MDLDKKIKLGSQTAKNGFRNEEDIIIKFNNWKRDSDAQNWLTIMKYNLDEIEEVKAVKIKGTYKTDVQVQVSIKLKKVIDCENLSIKLVSNSSGFNQIDKRWIDKYVELWNIPDEITKLLKLFTGELNSDKKDLRDKRRMFLDEMSNEEQNLILSFFKENKILIISDILKGREKFTANWMLVILKKDSNSYDWALKDINSVMNIYGKGEVEITNRGSLRIGSITMQRKGGDGGRDSAKMLQFKINPCLIFDKNE